MVMVMVMLMWKYMVFDPVSVVEDLITGNTRWAKSGHNCHRRTDLHKCFIPGVPARF